MQIVAEFFVLERRDGSESTAGLVVRIHAGCLKLDDLVSIAVDPEGQRHRITLTCVEIRLRENLLVDELGENFGGYVLLRGQGSDLVDHDWVLHTG